MVKIVYKVVVKKDRVDEFKKLAFEILIPKAHDNKCLFFSLHQSLTHYQEFIFDELWDNKDSVKKYINSLETALGESKPGEIFPARFNDFIEKDEDLVYEEI
ncbi:MAG TPA: antibiotic biosynthesis monooxygenase [Candidatus Saccharimonadales bacterium]|nr:antibiotic biosynthesis monooxygenase [Candidatus Saccharimonadales bacterium]